MNKKRIIITVAILMLTGMFMQTNRVEAALQSNGGEPARYNVNNWIKEIRNMQAIGGTLGLTDTINETDLTSNNTTLDIHMQKNTEYGAMLLLSASAYGNPNEIKDGDTTTGNETGIQMKINKEWVVAVPTTTIAIPNVARRYKDTYTAPNYTEKVGDAIQTVGAWHGSTSTTWLTSYYNQDFSIARCCLVRSYDGSIFSYYGYSYNNGYGDPNKWNDTRDGDYRKEWSSRAVVVIGSGT